MIDPIRIATLKDLNYVLALQRKFSNQLGFLPRAALEGYLDNGRVTIVQENDEPAGYILGRPALRWMALLRPITQAAIQYDAQRRHLGELLVARAEAEARDFGQAAIQVMCREGIDANAFWAAVGFQKIGQTNPQNARQRLMNCWRKPLNPVWTPRWFHALPPVSGHLARRTLEAQAQTNPIARTAPGDQ